MGDCATTGASGNEDSQIPPNQGFCSYMSMGWLIDNNVGPFFLGSRLDPESGMTSTVSSPRCMSPTVLSLGDLAPLDGFPWLVAAPETSHVPGSCASETLN